MPRVLVADDNALSLAFFVDAFATLGVQCATARDGGEAVERANTTAFDLLLIDQCMPVLDGPAALHAIRGSAGASCDAPAVATTAADPASRPDLLAEGFVEILGKPVTLNDLRGVLERHLVPSLSARDPPLLDDAQALVTSAGDTSIMAALRQLFAKELDALPGELAELVGAGNAPALQDRLHRLDASAGFCGAPAVAAAVAALRRTIGPGAVHDGSALRALIRICADTRSAIKTAA